ncbi:kinesin-like protein KIN-7N isoform X2 [Andrographis paniculata]|uniref:kinesin-like protein KIN-7N isoform X2 n=1 Tax=Andrographis paniculata TaxID=175694 RepID=UPI0021E7FCF3|nr:kinesin-like protein KIN-7N isoform X2 [Andrographis paniculata]
MEKICVAVRLRPSASEDSVNAFNWKVDSNRVCLHRSDGPPVSGLSFAFDHVFDQECSNETVYDRMIKGITDAAVEGFNGTAFAYGQTSSGKTFTMNGSENNPGIIPRAVKDIFGKIQEATDREFLIRVSYMEIYNEDINDLFALENQKLQIHESLERGVFVAGLREEIVNNADQVLNLIQLGEANRHFGETNMNARSSRSHTVFRMVIESKAKYNKSSLDDAIRVSVLNLVDLAGSERVAKTGAGGVRLKEGKHINKSLMILGNVINKLSEGGKQRGHIPYRDSKLTRILQPALGGNAKTSIICTVAPEEIHIEESKGTLQFASRAKRITNCVQVNEILTDAALLKRQKLEIEELRSKLQGSHAEVLEQEILKLRKDMLKYELEREKLAAELEEERRSQKERDQCIREQQMKIDNLSNLVTLSESDRNLAQDDVKAHVQARSANSQSTCQEDTFSTPCFKAPPKGFVARRTDYSMLPECSPLPDVLGDFADEDTWMKMNKGFIADLDSLHMTPARKVQSFPFSEDSSMESCSKEMQNLHMQLKIVTEERDEVKRKYDEQALINNQLARDVADLQKEIEQIRVIPKKLHETVADCKDIYKDVFSILQNYVSDDLSATAQILSTTSEVGTSLFSTLESHLLMAVDGKRTSLNDNSIREQCNMLHQKLRNTVSSLILSDTPTLNDGDSKDYSICSSKIKGSLGEQIACWKQALENEVKTIKQKYKDLEDELNVTNQLLKVSEGKYNSLEREFHLLKQDRDAALKSMADSSQMLEQITAQKEKALKDLSTEIKMRKTLEEDRDAALRSMADSSQMLEQITAQKEKALQDLSTEIQMRKILEEDRDAALNSMADSSQILEQITVQKEKALKDLSTEILMRKTLEEDRDAALKNMGDSSQMLEQITAQKEKALKDLSTEIQMRRTLEEDRDAALKSMADSSQMLEQITALKEKALKDLSTEIQMRKTLEEDRDAALKSMADSSQMLEQITAQKEKALKDLSTEIQMRKTLEEDRDAALKSMADSSQMLEQITTLKEKALKDLSTEIQMRKTLEEDRDAALKSMADSSQMLEQITAQKEKALKDLSTEIQMRKTLEEDRDAALKSMADSSQMLEQITTLKEKALKDLSTEIQMRKKLEEDRDVALKNMADSSQMLEQITAQKEKALKDLSTEIKMRRTLEEEIKQFRIAFASRQRSLISMQSDLKSIFETMKVQNHPASLSKSYGS